MRQECCEFYFAKWETQNRQIWTKTDGVFDGHTFLKASKLDFDVYFNGSLTKTIILNFLDFLT